MLDKQVEAILSDLAAAEAPALHELPPAEARVAFRMLSQGMNALDVPIGSVEDQAIPGPAGDIPVRIYTPVASGGVTPVLVYYHGGGWVIGDLDTHDTLCRTLANEAHCKVVAVDYRLAPENPWPAAVEDAYAALQWVESHAVEINVDPNHIAVAGDSAGGNLAAVVSLRARDEKGPHICYQVLLYPVTDAAMDTGSHKDFSEGYFLEREGMKWFFDCYAPEGTDRSAPWLSPLRAGDLSALPKALVITAGYDVLRDEGIAYAKAMQDAGVDVECINYEGMIHGFFGLQAVLDKAQEAVRTVSSRLEAAFS